MGCAERAISGASMAGTITNKRGNPCTTVQKRIFDFFIVCFFDYCNTEKCSTERGLCQLLSSWNFPCMSLILNILEAYRTLSKSPVILSLALGSEKLAVPT